MKRAVWTSVRARQSSVTDSKSFAACAMKLSKSTKIIHLTTSDVKARAEVFDKRVQDIAVIPAIQKVRE